MGERCVTDGYLARDEELYKIFNNSLVIDARPALELLPVILIK